VCERFDGTVLHHFYRPHFHLGRVDNMGLLDRSLQTWLVDYNQHRPNHGDYMAGRTPLEVKKDLRRRQGSGRSRRRAPPCRRLGR
jgi:hypothetical protein